MGITGKPPTRQSISTADNKDVIWKYNPGFPQFYHSVNTLLKGKILQIYTGKKPYRKKSLCTLKDNIFFVCHVFKKPTARFFSYKYKNLKPEVCFQQILQLADSWVH